MQKQTKTRSNLLDLPILEMWHINLEVALYILLGIVAAVACFYNLGARTISHDESLHALYSWKLFAGQGYEHNPMMHGPFLFHANALMYLLFGTNDFTARIVPALFGIVLVLLPWFLRKELGRVGALVTGVLTLISPTVLYHARYIRNDIYMMVWAMLMCVGLFRYFDSRQPKWIYLAAWAVTMSMCTKETAYITGFIGFTFLVILFVQQMLTPQGTRTASIVGLVAMLAMAVTALFLEKALPTVTSDGKQTLSSKIAEFLIVPIGILIPMLIGAMLVRRDGRLRQPLQLIAAYVLALLALAVCAGVPGGFLWFLFLQLPAGMLPPLVFTLLQVVVAGAGAAAGVYLWWQLMQYAHQEKWLPEGFSDRVMYITLAVVVVPFVLLYSTFFTNPAGLGSGTVGAIAYWLAQQEVKRAGQPWYYYIMLAPLYDFLPLILSVVATAYYLITGKVDRQSELDAQPEKERKPSLPFVAWAVYWAISAWFLYSWAGEKMPWLVVHIVQPMLLLGGRFVDDMVYGIDWREAWRRGGAILALLTPLLIFCLGMLIGLPLFGQAFQGMSITDLQDTLRWLLTLGVGVGLAVIARKIVGQIGTAAAWRVAMVALLGVGMALTVHYAVMACYINYDTAQEFLVYAHGTPDVKQTVQELKEISRRLYGDERAIKFSYSSDATWPFEWYFDTNFPNRVFFGRDPSRENTDVPVLVVGSAEIVKTEPFLGTRYYRFDRKLVWWPHQDYYMSVSFAMPGQDMGTVRSKGANSITVELWGQTAELGIDSKTVYRVEGIKDATLQNVNLGDRIAGKVVKQSDGRLLIRRLNVLRPYKSYFFLDMQSVEKRQELWDILFYRKYKQPLADWQPSHAFALYIRKDIAAQLWDFGTAPTAAPVQESADEDRYTAGIKPLQVAAVWGSYGSADGQMINPRNVAVGPDGSIYVADSGNGRIQKFTADGRFVTAWGHTCRVYENMAGCQNAQGQGGMWEPWDLAVDASGFVYVVDTWNHRVQKFTSDGQFVTTWGQYGVVDGAVGGSQMFWGPRAVTISPDGLILVSDTGNKRIIAFTPNGELVAQWGGKGVGDGLLEEPVGVAIVASGTIYVADTWNQRIQVFDNQYRYLRKWEIDSWYGQSLENKPYLALDPQGRVYATDPEAARILIFDPSGRFVATLGGSSADTLSLVRPTGIAIDAQGYIYVADTLANQIIKLMPFEKGE